MRLRKILYYLVRITFLDEVLGLFYCILLIFGIIEIGQYDANMVLKILVTLVYVFVMLQIGRASCRERV